MAEHKTSAAAIRARSSSSPCGASWSPPRRPFSTARPSLWPCPSTTAQIGIGRAHSPLIGRLGYGELRLKSESGHSERYYVGGGFVQVAGNVVSVLTQQAILADKLDTGVAAENLRAAHHRRADNEAALEERERLEAQARAQLRMARHR